MAEPKVLKIIEEQATSPLIDVLRSLQQEEGCLTEASLKALASDRVMSLTRLYGIATSYPEFSLEKVHEEARPQSNQVPLPGFLEGFRDSATATVRKAGPLISMWSSKPGTLPAYREAGGMEGYAQAASASPEQTLSAITKGGFTRKAKAWLAASSSDEEPVLVANCHNGDPVAGQASSLLKSGSYSILEGLYIGALSTGARRGFLYLDPADSDAAPELLKKSEEIQRDANINFAVEVFTGPAILVGSDDTVAVAAIEGDRPVPAASAEKMLTRGIWAKPTIIDSAECFAAIARALGTKSDMENRLYQVGGNVESPGIYEVPAGMSLGELLSEAGAGAGGEVLIGGMSGLFPGDDGQKFPLLAFEREDGPRWRTIFVLDETNSRFEAAKAVTQYNTRYLCGGCIPCRIGSVRMAEILNKETPETGTLKELAFVLEKTGLCQTGRGAAALVLSSLQL